MRVGTKFALPLVAAATLALAPPASAEPADNARLLRQLALAAELEAEGAADEARLVLAEIELDEVGGDLRAPRSAEVGGPCAVAATAPNPPGGAPGGRSLPLAAPRPRSVGSWLARGVVSFYRAFVGPAIGARCVLEPSCSRYFLEAGRKHGLLCLPMVADRFVREPMASSPDRPWVQTPSGQWRHPDPVSDHDWWFQ